MQRKSVILLVVLTLLALCNSFTFSQNSDSKKYLGRLLFFDKSLSINASKSCSSCHNPSMAFTDGYRQSVGVTGQLTTRNSPSLINVSRQNHFTWTDITIVDIKQHMDIPLFGTLPIEMGLTNYDSTIYLKLLAKYEYKELIKLNPLYKDSLKNVSFIKDAIAHFVFSINSYNSDYDFYIKGNSYALSRESKHGKKLFFSKKINCASCHVPPYFGADSSIKEYKQYASIRLHNSGTQTSIDSSLFYVTKKPTDFGKFKIPSVRNLKYTAPYFHDGNTETLQEVLQLHTMQFKNKENLKRMSISAKEIKSILTFLESLNDSSIITNKEFQNPFTNEN